MKKHLAIVLGVLALTACTRVPAGYVGVKVDKYGDNRGVNNEVVGPGSYYAGWNVDYYLFPTFFQTHVWTKAVTEGSPTDESFTFQTQEGTSVNTDVGITYNIPKDKAAEIFSKYHQGVDELTNVVLRALVRDALSKAASTMPVEEVYGKGRAVLQNTVEKEVKAQAAANGIIVDKVYLINEMRLPPQVLSAINAKTAATQLAQQKENELAATKADAQKEIEKAKGDAEAARIRGEAMIKTPQYHLQELTIQKWDGKLPQYTGSGAVPFMKLN